MAAREKDRLGAYGEACAARHLVASGMLLLDRNWRCEVGEIDLVLRDRNVLVICEVKTRSSTRFGSPLEAVTRAKADRLRLLAARWCEERDVHVADMRIDVVGVLMSGASVARIDHLKAVA